MQYQECPELTITLPKKLFQCYEWNSIFCFVLMDMFRLLELIYHEKGSWKIRTRVC